MVGIYKRGDILYIQYELKGKNVQKSTRLKDTKENRKLLENEVIPALKIKLLNNDFDTKKPQTFEHYSKFYLEQQKHLKTIKTITAKVKTVNSYFGHMLIDRITKHDVKLFVQDRDNKDNTPKTIRNYLAVVRGIIDIAIDEEVIYNNVAQHIRLPKHTIEEIEPFTEQEVITLLSKSKGFLQRFLAISFYTGMRTGEVLALMDFDIKIDTMLIEVNRALSEGKISTPKTQKSIRRVPIFEHLLPYLNTMKLDSLYLFPKNDGLPYKSFPGHYQRQWVQLLEECNIKYRKIYSTRHTFIVNMLKHSELSVLEIAQIVGHTNTKMIIQNYAKFIKGEHLKVSRKTNLYTVKTTDILT